MNHAWMTEFREFCKTFDYNPNSKLAVDQYKLFRKSGLTL